MSLTMKKPLAVLAATSALLGSGMLTAGAASAAPTTDTPTVKVSTSDEGRLIGPFVTRAGSKWRAWEGGVGDSSMTSPNYDNEIAAVQAAATYTFPGANNIGEIRPANDDGLCLTNQGLALIMKCDGSPKQQWFIHLGLDNLVDIKSKTNNFVLYGAQTQPTTTTLSTIAGGTRDLLNLSLLKPVPDVPVIALTASVQSTNTADKTAVVTGKGTPGATILIKDDNGDTLGWTTVDQNGTWRITTKSLHAGSNPVTVQSLTGNAEDTEEVKLTIEMPIAGLVAGIDSTDDANKSAEISGKGEPGATITITYPENHTVTTTVDKDGTWHATAPDLTVGENPIRVTHAVNGQETDATDMMVIIGEQATPAIHPAIAASALGLGLAGASLRRITRNKS